MKVGMLAVGLATLLAATAQAGDDTFKIARDKSLPGKFGRESCDTFARSLYNKLVQAGGEAHYIVYEWQNPNTGRSGTHAIVVYRDSKGRYFGMDQSLRQPIWLSGGSDAVWVSWFNGPGYTRVLRSQTEPSLEGQYADLSRPSRNPGSMRMLASN